MLNKVNPATRQGRTTQQDWCRIRHYEKGPNSHPNMAGARYALSGMRVQAPVKPFTVAQRGFDLGLTRVSLRSGSCPAILNQEKKLGRDILYTFMHAQSPTAGSIGGTHRHAGRVVGSPRLFAGSQPNPNPACWPFQPLARSEGPQCKANR